MKKRLITERDVQQLPLGGKLAVDRDTIVTPAARDLCFARGIEIAPAGSASSTIASGASSTSGATRSGASAASCGCNGCKSGGACACEGPWPKLADGEYLLEVRDGRVRARRIEH